MSVLKPTKTLEELSSIHNVPLEQLQLQFKKGIATEMEHTTDERIAQVIALHHIEEMPDYYDKLLTIETKQFKHGGVADCGCGDNMKFKEGGSVEETYRQLLFIPEKDAIYIIKEALKNDEYYILDNFALDKVSACVYRVFLYCFEHNKSFPILSRFGDKVIFEPDCRLVEREDTYLLALIKYAAHLVTGGLDVIINGVKVKHRVLDKSKIENFDLLKETIINPDEKYESSEKKEDGRTRVYYIKYITNKKNVLVCFNIAIEDNKIIECVTFMPNKKSNWIQKQIAKGTYIDAALANDNFLLQDNALKEDYVSSNRIDTVNPAKISIEQAKIDELIENNKKKFLEGGVTDENGLGEKFLVKNTGQVIELEGGEGVMCPSSMQSDRTFMFEGKKMTGREVASLLNHKYDGIEFAHGGEVGHVCGCKQYSNGGELSTVVIDELQGGEAVITVKAMESKDKYKFNGSSYTPRQILSQINLESGGKKFENGGLIDLKKYNLQMSNRLVKMVYFAEKLLHLQ